MDTEKKYYAKLMLTGEYAVIVGGEALTIPLKKYSAQLLHKDKAGDEKSMHSSFAEMRKLYYYLKSLPKKAFHAKLELEDFDAALKQGYYIESNIPQGYGIGSSGAVSALVYDQFFSDKETLPNTMLKKDLGLIESHFHGKSSGVDSLSCYLGEALHFDRNSDAQVVEFDPSKLPGAYRFFILDSGESMETEPLVAHFLEQMKEKDFRQTITDDYLPLNKILIEILMGQKQGDAGLVFRAISDLQWKHFRKMIPARMEDAWLDGQVSNLYYLKLNGSGGGFMLGLCHKDSMELTEQMLGKERISWV